MLQLDYRISSAMNIKLLASLTIFGLTTLCQASPLNSQILQTTSNLNVAKTLSPTNIPDPENFLVQRKGAGKNHVVQGLALDPQRSLLYTSHVVTAKPETVAINQFKFQNSHVWQAQSAQAPSDLIGHQGISVEPHSGLLLASAGSSIENRGWYIVQFSYSANQQPSSPRIIQVFDQGYSKNTNSMPIISPDGKYLIVRSAQNKKNVIRVFKYDLLNQNNKTNISQDYQYEWTVEPSLTQDNYPFQAMTTDGEYVYFISGFGEANKPKRIFVYTIKGQLVQKLNNISLGQQYSSMIGQSKYWEPEGMSYNPITKQLYILFAVGDSGKRLGLVYKINLS